ncbi:MAG TPA: hypothetical protein VN830_01470 [Verrucomicrobiae bacterium]|nr:hypothetical protein [Verrucomicrobiae bacterium]
MATKTHRADKRSVFRQIVDIADAQFSATRLAILQRNPAPFYRQNALAEMFSLNFIIAQYHGRALSPAEPRYQTMAVPVHQI